MKKSNILILCLIAFSFLAMIGSGLSLKSQFNKIDRKDPFSGFKKTSLKSFRYVRLSGNYFGATQIEPGDQPQIKVITGNTSEGEPRVTWKISNDTLIVSYKHEDAHKLPYSPNLLSMTPNVLIITPRLSSLTSHGIIARIKGWTADSLSIQQKGFGIILQDNNFKSLSTNLSSGAHLEIEGKNHFIHSVITLKDSSSMSTTKDVFQSLRVKADSTAQIALPGSLLRKMTTL
jgi:hypothetical protein